MQARYISSEERNSCVHRGSVLSDTLCSATLSSFALCVLCRHRDRTCTHARTHARTQTHFIVFLHTRVYIHLDEEISRHAPSRGVWPPWFLSSFRFLYVGPCSSPLRCARRAPSSAPFAACESRSHHARVCGCSAWSWPSRCHSPHLGPTTPSGART